MNDKITIDNGTENDVESIIKLINAVADLHGKCRGDILKDHPYHVSIDKLSAFVKDESHIVIVAKYNYKIIGVMLCKMYSLKGDNKYKDANIMSIEDTYVLNEYRRSGVATKMIEYAIQKARTKQCNRIETNVWAFNNASNEFFRSNDFKVQKFTLERKIDG